jgi:ABC-2 type transport system permease protein
MFFPPVATGMAVGREDLNNMERFLLAAFTLWQREMTRFFRQRSRVIGALAPPIVFWFLIGSGLGTSFQLAQSGVFTLRQGVNYLQYFFPGTIVLIVLFTAIFSTISIIEDRHEGFLQSVLVAPVPRGSLVLGNIAGGATLAFVQGLIFLVFAPLTGIRLTFASFLLLALMLLLISFGLAGLGFLLAWRLDSTQGFHAVMNLFLIPMWLLSGALFPLSGAPRWFQWVMRMNPLTYGVAALSESFYVHGQPLQAGVASLGTCLSVTIAFAVLIYAASAASVRKI